MREVEKNHLYFTCNLHQPEDLSGVPTGVRKLLEVRQHARQQEWWKYAEGVQDVCKSTLWLLGSAECGTHFHVDWAEANNMAWATDGKVCALIPTNAQTALVVWKLCFAM